jgi:CRP/FNR family transcriptional regulator
MAIALATRQTPSDHHPSFVSPPNVRAAAMRPDYLRPVPAAAIADIVEAELQRIGSAVSCRRGKMLVEEGDAAEYLFKVESGALRAVRLLPDGRRYITSFLMPGDFFGLADTAQYSSSVEAVSDARLVRYARRSFEAMFEHDARVGRRFFGLMSKELSAAQDRLVLLGRKTALERLAVFLLVMAERQVEGGKSDGGRVELPMSRSDVADYLGLRIETVSRILTALRKQGVIALPDPHSFTLLDRDALEDLSDSEV